MLTPDKNGRILVMSGREACARMCRESLLQSTSILSLVKFQLIVWHAKLFKVLLDPGRRLQEQVAIDASWSWGRKGKTARWQAAVEIG